MVPKKSVLKEETKVGKKLSMKKIKAQLIVNAGGIISGGDGNYFRDKDAQVMAYNEDQPNNGVTIYGAEGEALFGHVCGEFCGLCQTAGIGDAEIRTTASAAVNSSVVTQFTVDATAPTFSVLVTLVAALPLLAW